MRSQVTRSVVGLSLALSAGLAQAQDSVATSNGLPGDAVSAYAIGASGEQVNNYVVDLTTRVSSWGRPYRVGPVAKSSLSTTSGFFNHLIGAQAVSNRFFVGPAVRPSYLAWALPGQGVSGTANTAPTDNGTGRYGTIATDGLNLTQFGYAFNEFAGGPDGTFGTSDDDNNVIAGVVGFDSRAPGRVYVTRVVSAVNKSGSTSTSGTASMGIGGVDELGNVALIADGFGMGSGAIINKRVYRVDALARSTGLNQLNNAGVGDAAATRTLLTTDVSLVTPTLVSEVLATRPVVIGGDFAGNFLFEQTANSLASTQAYLPAGGQPRGPVSFTASRFTAVANGLADTGTAAVLSRASGDTRTRGISVWGVNTDGSIDNQLRVVLPAAPGTLVDPTDGFDPFAVVGFNAAAEQDFTNFASQVCFRGGSGPVGVVVLPDGDLLLAATVAATGDASAIPQSMDNYLAVARIDAETSAATWTIAAHTGGPTGSLGGSKVILGDNGEDGIPGTFDGGEGDGNVDFGPNAFVGRLARFNEVVTTASGGASISAPAVDTMGNLYFLATVSLKTTGAPRLTTALLRANLDPATSGYSLEILAEVGDVLAGLNSGRNYQIQFMGTGDSDSVDSGAIWSSNIVQSTSERFDPATLNPGSAFSLGALVFRCRVVYDRNNDGLFRDPTQPGNTGSADQAYNVVMMITPEFLLADFNLDGVVNDDDLGEFITAYFSENLAADFNRDGSLNDDDLGEYITAYFNP